MRLWRKLAELFRPTTTEKDGQGEFLNPYMRITKREDVPDGEIVTLECGHQVHIIHHRMESIPCEECNRKKERTTK